MRKRCGRKGWWALFSVSPFLESHLFASLVNSGGHIDNSVQRAFGHSPFGAEVSTTESSFALANADRWCVRMMARGEAVSVASAAYLVTKDDNSYARRRGSPILPDNGPMRRP